MTGGCNNQLFGGEEGRQDTTIHNIQVGAVLRLGACCLFQTPDTKTQQLTLDDQGAWWLIRVCNNQPSRRGQSGGDTTIVPQPRANLRSIAAILAPNTTINSSVLRKLQQTQQ